MKSEDRKEQPLEERLNLIPPDRLPRKGRLALAKLAKDLDRVGRRDADSQELYLDEASFRKVLEKHLPSSFVGRLLPMLQDMTGGRDLIRAAPARGKGSAVLWETVAADKGMRVKQKETFEGLGLEKASTMEDLRKALKPHLPDVPDDVFSDKLGDRVRLALDRLASSAEGAGTTVPRAAAGDYWAAFGQCFAQHAGMWWRVAATVFVAALIVGLVGGLDPFTAVVGALIIAGVAIPIWFLISAVYCFIAAAFA